MEPPGQGYVKFNSDATFSATTGKGSHTTVCRDHEGKILTMQAARLFAISPIAVEPQSLREAMKLATLLQLQKVVFEFDKLRLINACKKETQIGEIQGIIDDIREMELGFQDCGFTWINREGNGVAHELASLFVQGKLTGNWTANPPSSLRLLIDRERQSFVLNPNVAPYYPQV